MKLIHFFYRLFVFLIFWRISLSPGCACPLIHNFVFCNSDGTNNWPLATFSANITQHDDHWFHNLALIKCRDWKMTLMTTNKQIQIHIHVFICIVKVIYCIVLYMHTQQYSVTVFVFNVTLDVLHKSMDKHARLHFPTWRNYVCEPSVILFAHLLGWFHLLWLIRALLRLKLGEAVLELPGFRKPYAPIRMTLMEEQDFRLKSIYLFLYFSQLVSAAPKWPKSIAD